MEMDTRMMKIIQKRLKYTDEEFEIFKADPRNIDVLSKHAEVMKSTLIFEVVESHGCNSRHKVGDKFYFDGAGNLLTSRCPKNICVFVLSAVSPLIYTATELIYAGVDPNEMRFKRTGCIDVGLKCGGWGHVVVELQVENPT